MFSHREFLTFLSHSCPAAVYSVHAPVLRGCTGARYETQSMEEVIVRRRSSIGIAPLYVLVEYCSDLELGERLLAVRDSISRDARG